jgi:hypothetical protein
MVSSPRLSLELIPNKYNVLSVRLDVIWNRISKWSLIIAEVNSNELGRPAIGSIQVARRMRTIPLMSTTVSSFQERHQDELL